MPLPAPLTVDELKARLDKENDDDLLEAFLEAAVEQAAAPPPYGCGRLLSPSPAWVGDPLADTAPPVTRRLRARGRRFINVPDARVITSVVVDGSTVTDYEVTLRNGLIVQLELPMAGYGQGYGYGGVIAGTPYPNIALVTGRFGFTTLPPALVEAIYQLAARMWFERESNQADVIQTAEGAPVQSYFKNLPPRTRLAFTTFALPAGYGGLA